MSIVKFKLKKVMITHLSLIKQANLCAVKFNYTVYLYSNQNRNLGTRLLSVEKVNQ